MEVSVVCKNLYVKLTDLHILTLLPLRVENRSYRHISLSIMSVIQF